MLRPETHATVALVRGGVELACWPLTNRRDPDLGLVDQLARWQLAAHRLGCCIRVRDASVELWSLLELLGLAEILTGVPALGVEVGREAEDGEEPGVEEVVEPDDPVA